MMITIDKILNSKKLEVVCTPRQIKSLEYLVYKLNKDNINTLNKRIEKICRMLNAGIDYSLYPRLRRIMDMNRKLNLLKFVIFYGKIQGLEKWNIFCRKNAETNSFEYKQKHNNMSREEFEAFNKSRAVTKENLIKKYGEEKGIEKWNSYVEKQRVNGSSKEYFISKYGEEKGIEKFLEVNKRKGHTFETYLLKYKDEKIAREKLKEFHTKINFSDKSQSKIASKLFYELDEIIPIELSNKSKFNPKCLEYCEIDRVNNKCYMFDYVLGRLKIIIEFHGDYWHANPSIYKPNDLIRGEKASDKWENDYRKQNFMEKLGFDYYVIWESDFIKNKEEVVNKLYNIIMEKYNNNKEIYGNQN